MSMKTAFRIALVSAVTMAIVYRVPPVRAAIIGQ